MSYVAELIQRSESDVTGQELADKVSAHVAYLSSHGLDEFQLVPVQNSGTTVGIIIAARGERPGAAEERKAFIELTGYNSPLEMMKDLDRQEAQQNGADGP